MNTAWTHKKRAARHRALSSDEQFGLAAPYDAEHPEVAGEILELRGRLKEALDRLPASQRKVVVLKDVALSGAALNETPLRVAHLSASITNNVAEPNNVATFAGRTVCIAILTLSTRFDWDRKVGSHSQPIVSRADPST